MFFISKIDFDCLLVLLCGHIFVLLPIKNSYYIYIETTNATEIDIIYILQLFE